MNLSELRETPKANDYSLRSAMVVIPNPVMEVLGIVKTSLDIAMGNPQRSFSPRRTFNDYPLTKEYSPSGEEVESPF